MRRTPALLRLVAGLTLVVGLIRCGGGAVGTARFANRPPVWRVNDRKNVPVKPEERDYPKTLYFADRGFFRLITRRMEVPEPGRAANVNALDEVPDSTWFVNRIGRRDLTPLDVARGPGAFGGPDLSAPWRVVGTKVGGTAVGLLVKDGRDVKYLIKFDERAPIVETAADVVSQRILWAAGYHVPEDSIAYRRREQFVLGEGATTKVFGKKRPMTQADLDDALGKVQWNADGTVRVLASRFLDGVPIGGFANSGVREDDPNDTIPHEDRRELRGLYAFFAWVHQVDIKEDNTLDMWAQDPRDPDVHYVMHYLVDFGKSLGAMGKLNYRPDAGHTYAFDFEYSIPSIATLGLWERPWEGTARPALGGVGVLDAEHFDPDAWKGVTSYTPFLARDEYDMFWATKIILRFSREHVRAAVEQGRYPDPAAAAYVEEALVGRQRKIGRTFLRRVNPLDGFELSEAPAPKLCFSDLWHTHGFADPSEKTRYEWAAFDHDARPLGDGRADPGERGRSCVERIPLGGGRDGYTIVSLTTHRGPRFFKPVEVHLARDPSGRPRIVGIERR